MRMITSASRTLVLLAPSQGAVPPLFSEVNSDPDHFENLLEQMQRFRGRVYVEDGAVKADQLIDGRHWQESDQGSWHLLLLDQRGGVCGCARYREYPAETAYSDLNVARSAIAQSHEWGSALRSAVGAEMNLSRQLGRPLSESGGWALHEEIRGTTEALRMALAAYALAQELGGTVGLTTATRRHGSASILRRMGGRSLEFCGSQIPSYYDPQYECEMEILRFYSWAPNPRYNVWIDEMKADLRATQVITNGAAGPEWVSAMRARRPPIQTRTVPESPAN